MSRYGDGDYGDDDLDDEDAYDGLSDYDDDLETSGAGEGPSGGADRRSEVGYGSRSSHMGRSNMPSSSGGRHATNSEYRRYRTTSERLPPDPSDDNRCFSNLPYDLKLWFSYSSNLSELS